MDAIHEFGKRENSYLMSVGDTKGKQVEESIRERKPKLVLELGSYVGFSGIAFSRVSQVSYAIMREARVGWGETGRTRNSSREIGRSSHHLVG